ncbi:MAG: uncharacterized protein KVP18_001820 [Porospora cf. gigantea A]|uniref:uncharacterized protein n=1 Tax=Porospora cf. gigantea A TaxID=2853593 RepID=UPI00355A499C|nr:MAG: hypothetical protein KVP18_001820 [Porospora cf. gigantea A]
MSFLLPYLIEALVLGGGYYIYKLAKGPKQPPPHVTKVPASQPKRVPSTVDPPRKPPNSIPRKGRRKRIRNDDELIVRALGIALTKSRR